uniref:Uncharacterized protein n=1 Tax=Arundo donax TaxID=35708 RepID=A0A0A9G3N7_ARUDO
MESSICSNGWRAMETTTCSRPVNHSGDKQSSLSFSHDKWRAMIFSYVYQGCIFRSLDCVQFGGGGGGSSSD